MSGNRTRVPGLHVRCANHCTITTTLLETEQLERCFVSRGAPRRFIIQEQDYIGSSEEDSQATRNTCRDGAVVSTPDMYPGNAGSIPTHGICVFSFKLDQSVFRTGS